MRNIIALIAFLVSLVALGQSTDENYKLETNYKVPVQEPNLNSVFIDDKIEIITYYDGLGRPKQINNARVGTGLENITQHIEYDRFGRQQKQYLPLSAHPILSSGHLDYRNGTSVVNSVNSYYDQEKFENITNPYSETRYETSPLSRPLEIGHPGDDWLIDPSLDTDHTIKYEYGFNNLTDEVNLFSLAAVSGGSNDPNSQTILFYEGYYLENTLRKAVMKNENWKPSDGYSGSSVIFTNKNGDKILERVYEKNNILDTYFIYDDFGNLVIVLSPEASKQIISGGQLSTTSGAIIEKLSYQYHYDHRNRIIQKKTPGKDWEYFIYDKLDRPILTQDGLLRDNNQWLFTKFDGLGRKIYSGLYTTTDNRTTIENAINSQSVLWESRTSNQSPIDGKNTYYTNAVYPSTNLTLHSINYYNNYNFDADGQSIPSSVYGQSTTSDLQGLMTGSIVRVLGQNDWITSLTGYDLEKRTVYVTAKNSFHDTEDDIESLLDFEGKVLESKTTHQKGNDPSISYIDYFSYDKMNRVKSLRKKINDQPIELIHENYFDELGRLIKKNVGGETVLDGYSDIVNLEIYSDNTITKTGTDGWNAGLTTKGAITANSDGGVSFTVVNINKKIKIGLAEPNNTTDPNDINYAFYLSDVNDPNSLFSFLYIYVDGVQYGTNYGTYQIGDVLKIVRANGTIVFKKGLQTLETIQNAPTAKFIGDLTFYSTGASVENFGLTGNGIDYRLQEIDYTYTARGWLKEINPIGSGDALFNGDLFHLKLNYNSKEGNAPGEELYNGNISQMIWLTKNDNVKRGYGYMYDDINRLLEANSRQGSDLNIVTNNTVNNISYDLNGNILFLDRMGRNVNNSGDAWWDKLSYTYDGNQLLGVVDTANNTSEDLGFKDDALSSNDDYSYDNNGNLEIDDNKDITNINYNHLNLPTTITFTSGRNINYIYDAMGIKLQKSVVSGGAPAIVTSYANGYIYEDDDLEFFSTEEGYVQKKNSVVKYDRGGGTTYITSFQFVYQYSDHLGNVRLSYTDANGDNVAVTSEIIEESNYYPFGLKHRGYNFNISSSGNSKAQQWKYNGQEFNEDFDINFYEMDLRQYDPAIARWTSIDPITHHSMSTYNAFDNNPIIYADPSGSDSVRFDDMADLRPISYGLDGGNAINWGGMSNIFGVGTGGFGGIGAVGVSGAGSNIKSMKEAKGLVVDKFIQSALNDSGISNIILSFTANGIVILNQDRKGTKEWKMAKSIAQQYGGNVEKIYAFLKKHPLSYHRDSNGKEYIDFNGHGWVMNKVMLDVQYTPGVEIGYIDKAGRKAVESGFTEVLKKVTGGIFRKSTGIFMTKGSLEADQTMGYYYARTKAVQNAKQKLLSRYFEKSFLWDGQKSSMFDLFTR